MKIIIAIFLSVRHLKTLLKNLTKIRFTIEAGFMRPTSELFGPTRLEGGRGWVLRGISGEGSLK